VLFLTESGTARRNQHDWRTSSYERALQFVAEANLAGVITRLDPLLDRAAAPGMLAAAHDAALLLGTFGNANNDPAVVHWQVREVMCDVL
jgi:glycerophosphoryl diester phosphodiesterase